MKKVFIFTLSFIFSLTIYGQKHQTVTYEKWDSNNNKWINDEKDNYSYDANGYMVNVIKQKWDATSGSWKSYSQHNYINNPNGTAQQDLYQYWNEQTSSWENSGRASSTYVLNTKIEKFLIESWTGSNWQNAIKYVFNYDNNGFKVNSTNFTWDFSLDSWKTGYQHNYINNPDETLQQDLTRFWNSSTSSWINVGRLTNTYLTGGKLETETHENWYQNNWKNARKINYTYDNNDYLLKSLTQIWTGLSWKNSSTINYTNNPDGTTQQYISQNWNDITSSWTNLSRTTYTSDNTLGIKETNQVAFHFFPNPSNDNLNISLSNDSETKIEITDLNGRLLLSKQISGSSTTIDVKELPSSLYQLHLQQGNKTSITKFIKN
jgi:Secretion system C-terminal sorting domain